MEQTIKNNSVAIIGNGITRKSMDLKTLQSYMPIYGCNALYRDFKPDMLFAIDDVIINEIIQSDFPPHKFHVPPLNEQFEPEEFNPNRPRENTGMVAMRYAIKNGFTELHCIGFDFLIDSEEYSIGNIYEGSNGYGFITKASNQDCINRAGYFNWFVDKNPAISFIMVFPKNVLDTMKVRVQQKDNLSYATY